MIRKQSSMLARTTRVRFLEVTSGLVTPTALRKKQGKTTVTPALGRKLATFCELVTNSSPKLACFDAF
jgi:redox-regulated HSP33 family molecular chaperone